MRYDIGLFSGHGQAEKDGSYDSGAVYGENKEANIAREIVNRASMKLRNLGIIVHQDEQNYVDNDTFGNEYTSKCVYSVHINAGKGQGSEMIVPLNEKYFETETSILKDMENLGLKNRGVKSRDYNTEAWVSRLDGIPYGGTDYYKEVRQAWSQGLSLTIFEVGFIDSSDLGIILNNIDNIATIIAKHLAKLCNKTLPDTTPTAPTAPPSTGGNKPVYRVYVNEVQIGAYREIKNIIKEVEDAVLNENWKVEIIKKV